MGQVTEQADVKEPGSTFKDKDGSTGWVLGKRRRIQIKKYGGKPFVDIREFYEKDGKVCVCS
jgi:hypothetical protein